jgi:histidyl-tRNA synthetase
MQKPGLPKGTRDFSAEQIAKRTYIFDTIKSVFVKYGFQPLETPSFERLSTLTGKYGEEGDQLLFKVLNSGNFLEKAVDWDNYKKLAFQICEKGLRYDLTVPFARYVVMNQGNLTFPFRRYQIQPVWRGDRPQKGRFQEFYQCDADLVGSTSLTTEAELIQIYDEAFARLNLPVVIKFSSRKILQGLADAAGYADKMMSITVAIDKLDKIGLDGVEKELREREIGNEGIEKIKEFLRLADHYDKNTLSVYMKNSEEGRKGIEEIEAILGYLKNIPLRNQLRVDLSLARGLSYYTGFICEVKALGAEMGSIGGGGRYDDLTGMFGLKNLSGVGISFGAERIFEVMEELQLFPENTFRGTELLFACFDPEGLAWAMPIARKMRDAGIRTELYPDAVKIKKQFEYADKKKIPFVAVIGSDEMAQNVLVLKNMLTGEQEKISADDTEAICNFLRQTK